MNRENDRQEDSGEFTGNTCPKNWLEIHKKFHKEQTVSVQYYTLKELAKIYKVCPSTFKRMVMPYAEKIGKRKGRYYSIPQVRLIFQHVDLPSNYTIKELAHLYHVSVPTFKGWLDSFQDELGSKPGHHYSLRQLFIILSKLDVPDSDGKEYETLSVFLQLCDENKFQ
jgi:hypothetical protein